MRGTHIHLALAVSVVLSISSCGTEARPVEASQKLKIYYFWSTAGDPHQHSSIKTGVEKAKLDGRIKDLEKGPVEIQGVRDPDTAEEAIAKARELRRSPETLAVIGHTYSGTTWSALPIYAEAGIPVIVTNATSPYLFHKHGERDVPNIDFAQLNANPASGPRFTNAFRLIASDTPDQASAIQLTIRELKKGGPEPLAPAKVMLICDETSHYNAKVYSKPMCDYLEHETTHRDLAGRDDQLPDYTIVSSRSVDLDHADLWGLITAIHAASARYIVLVGYNELAEEVIQGLTERASSASKPASQYTFIMTDAAFGSKFSSELDIYFTSPSRPHHNDKNCDSSEPPKETDSQPGPNLPQARTNVSTKNRGEKEVPETAEALAYDAVIILAESVGNCRSHLDRSCVLGDLRGRQGSLRGRCGFYDLHEGELQNANYYVYSNHDRNAGKADPKWCARSQDQGLKPFGGACKEPDPQSPKQSKQPLVGEQHQ
jgi:hypothetical protein